MAGKTTVLQKTYQIEDSAVNLYTAVTYGAVVGSCKIPTADNAVPLGIVDNDERAADALRSGLDQTGRNIAVKLDGIGEVKLAGQVTYGTRVILGEGGTVKALPTDAGTYNVIGYAEKTGEDGDVIPVRIAPQSVVVTV